MTPRAERVAGACAVAALAAFVWVHMDALGDTFWYVALGRDLLAQGFTERDPFTFTAALVPSTVRMPLSFATFALVERASGMAGLLAFGSALLTAALALVWLPGTRGTIRWALFPLLPLLVYAGRDDLCARGQLVADLSFAALLLCLVRLRDRDGEWTGPGWPRPAWLAPVALGAVWMNAHPSAVLGAGIAALDALVLTTTGSGTLRRARASWAFALLFLLGACTTPYGPGLLFDAVDLAALPSTRALDLFRPPDFRRAEVLGWLALATFALVASLSDQRPGRRSDSALLVLLLCLALSGRRHLPWLGMVTVSVLGRLGAGYEPLERPRVARVARAAAAAAVAWCVVAFVRQSKDPLAQMPVEGVARIEAERLPGNVLNAYHWGGYLDYVFGPTGRVFVDGRNYLFDRNEVFFDHDRIARLDEATPWLLDAYGIRTILWERGSALDAALATDPGWRLRYRGRIEVVYTRTPPIREP